MALCQLLRASSLMPRKVHAHTRERASPLLSLISTASVAPDSKVSAFPAASACQLE